MTYDFDKIIDRSGSDDLKHEVLKTRYGRDDLIPLWVADMDFETPPFIIDAIRKRLEHPIFGYTVEPHDYWSTVAKWIKDHHQWDVKPNWMTYVPGVVKGIGMAINAFTKPGDKVIIQTPVYHPFRMAIVGNDREVVLNPLKSPQSPHPTSQSPHPTSPRGGEKNSKFYEMDFDNLENILSSSPNNGEVRRGLSSPNNGEVSGGINSPSLITGGGKGGGSAVLILCNPHNPAGIQWSRETLIRLAEICHKHGVIVLSDEIHSDLALFGNKHIPFASVSKEAAEISVTFQAPTKTFNMAGIVSSYAIVPNAELRQQLFRWMGANELNEPHIFAPIATIAAYKHGEEWRQQMLHYVEQNILFTEQFFEQHIPGIKVIRPESSFLVWLDCRALGLDHDALQDLFVNKARLALNDGEIFDTDLYPYGPIHQKESIARGFMRINVGTPRSILRQALQQLAEAVGKIPVE